MAFVSVACFANAAHAADPRELSDEEKARGTRTVSDALQQLQAAQVAQANQPSMELRRKVAQRFGECIAKSDRLHDRAINFLLSGRPRDGWLLSDEKCFSKAIAPFSRIEDYGNGVLGSFPSQVMRALVADGLVRVDFRSRDPTDFSAVPPLAPPPPPAPGVPAPAKPSITDQVGECAARISPGAIRQLAQTNVTSEQEMAAIRALVPTFSQCLPPNVRLAFEPGALRDSSVLAYARLAFTLGVAGNAREGHR